ncbi:quinone-dependent dihydroorotate dehydrogenase [Haloferax mediterranei ATCC 33500]|nr:quinone-dependent dihydroorotate dehydrogenase [Haloferax mediterranei]AHZ22915.1 dihydroorotate dehydrogenase [Haloferax mediterranei ATCC 33500]EMA03082.1 dihydroorotate dehydrogenase 2 [Haloferax mediterranei ATCC 33500]MDX5987739.1 quinone-dependent dihydroorotate dehydrogenase [Haloferax mediterranei ATCC 33500]QCQ74218.1 quinone-dependent dihydroorotate dehydrogenase [Haloferax mediterranei ATCC 33500]
MNPYALAKPLLFSLPPETAHGTIHGLLTTVRGTPIESLLERRYRVDDPRLTTSAFGLEFPNPVGVAAGFDKNAEVPTVLAALGFGHVEVGGVTAKPQTGNPRPRMFRLPEDNGLINRMGLNNEGADAVGARLSAGPHPDIPVGVNLALSEVTPTEEAPEDYRYTYERVADGADYFVVNVSCPNSEGFRDLQNRDSLEAILGTLVDAGADPLLVKLSPDLPDPAVEDALDVVDELDLDGIIASNTTTSRPDSLQNPNQAERGGLSGKPIESEATEMVRFIAERTDVPIVGVGGVSDTESAYRKIRAGASMVQLYTGMVYEGPSIARDINRGLVERLEQDGFDSVEDAVGADL